MPVGERLTAPRLTLLLLVGLSSAALSACEERVAPPKPKATASAAAPSSDSAASDPLPEVPWRFPAAKRVVALGDVHGDLAATKAALKLGGLIDDDDHWSGGDAVLVQTGDVLDRGSDEQAILDLLLELQEEAAKAGGAVRLLNGNHELMNAMGDFRYVTPGGFDDFQDTPMGDDGRVARFPMAQRGRAAAFLPGGIYAKKLATHPVAAVVGDTVYAHGGVLPKYAGELDRMNREVGAWLLGTHGAGARVVQTQDSPVWSRHYSDEPDASDCALLDQALKALGAKRMVVGHTVQKTINTACDEKIWRIDVGMAAHYGGRPEVLELSDGAVQPLRGE